MENIIQHIHSVKLKKWAVISILLFVICSVISTFGHNVNAIVLDKIWTSLAAFIIYSSLSVYAIKDTTVTKYVMLLALISFCIYCVGVFETIDVWGIGSGNLDSKDYDKWDWALGVTQTKFDIVSDSIILIGSLLGFTSLKDKYQTCWTILTCEIGLSLFNSAIFAPSTIEEAEIYHSDISLIFTTFFGIINLISSTLILIVLIMLFRIKEK